MMQCRYYIPTLNLIGVGCVREIGKEARTLHGKKAFVVASVGTIGEGQARFVSDILSGSGVAAYAFCEAVPNPTITVVEKGIAAYRAEGCDIIVAVGGGSAIDTAKAIGMLVNNGGSIRDYEGVNKSELEMPPFIAISTTAGSGSEVTQFAVITDEDHSKFTIVDWHMTPNVSVNDPEMMLSMPPSLTAATGMDALSHAIEAYVSKNATPVTDGKAYKAIQLITASLETAVHDGQNLDARENMCYGSFLAATAFNNAGLGLTHAMSHPLGGMYNLPHGMCNAILLPYVVKFNIVGALDKYADVAVAMGVGKSWHSAVENAENIFRALQKLARAVDIPAGLAEVGVKTSDLPALAELAMLETIGETNPRSYTQDQVLEIYKAAY